jgi:hypothetical protein
MLTSMHGSTPPPPGYGPYPAQPPYPQAQPPYPAPPPYPPAYGGYPQQTDQKAVTALVLGILSLTCGGLLTGIPAVVVGVMSRKDIERSGGALGGGGLALAGIITGGLGTVITMAYFLLMMAGVVAGLTAKPTSTYTPPPPPSPTYAPPPTATTAPGPKTGPSPSRSTTYGTVEVIDVDPDDGSLRAQLGEVLADAADAKSPVLVQTTAKWCKPCQGFEKSLNDVRVQNALKGVVIVRVDIDEWERSELKDMDMDMGSVPWFFKLDAKLKRSDAISSGEWDDDIPENIAPVMRDYMAGRLAKRRHPVPKGEKM